MKSAELHFIRATNAIKLDGEPSDAIELTDGQVIVIDGYTVTLYDDLESALDPDEADADASRSLPLILEDWPTALGKP